MKPGIQFSNGELVGLAKATRDCIELSQHKSLLAMMTNAGEGVGVIGESEILFNSIIIFIYHQ